MEARDPRTPPSLCLSLSLLPSSKRCIQASHRAHHLEVTEEWRNAEVNGDCSNPVVSFSARITYTTHSPHIRLNFRSRVHAFRRCHANPCSVRPECFLMTFCRYTPCRSIFAVNAFFLFFSSPLTHYASSSSSTFEGHGSRLVMHLPDSRQEMPCLIDENEECLAAAAMPLTVSIAPSVYGREDVMLSADAYTRRRGGIYVHSVYRTKESERARRHCSVRPPYLSIEVQTRYAPSRGPSKQTSLSV